MSADHNASMYDWMIHPTCRVPEVLTLLVPPNRRKSLAQIVSILMTITVFSKIVFARFGHFSTPQCKNRFARKFLKWNYWSGNVFLPLS